jgi:uncharacterized protein YlbG (UPF0298 family)
MVERYALILGSSKFEDSNYNQLPCVENDVEGILEKLSKFGEFKKGNIKVLLNRDIHETAKEIEQFINRVDKHDFLLFWTW